MSWRRARSGVARLRPPRIGLIVPFVGFYEGIVPLREAKLAFASDIARRLQADWDVVDAGLVETEQAARDAAEDFLSSQVDAVIVAPAVAAFGALTWAALERLPRTPVAIWHVPLADTLPEGYDIKALIRHSAGLSVMAAANTLARHHRTFRVFHGPSAEEMPDGLPRGLPQFCLAARAAAAVRTGTLLRVGSAFPSMTDVTMDGPAWHMATGGRVVDVQPAVLHARFAAIDEMRVAARVERFRGRRLDPTALSDDELARSVQLALALEDIVDEHDAVGGAFNCHGENCLQDAAIGITGCLGVSWMAGAGCPFSCTGDLPTAVALIIAKQLSGTAIYGELDFVDDALDRVLVANGGEDDVCATDDGYALFPNENFVGIVGRGASVAMPTFEGPATLISFTPLDGGGDTRGYKVIAAFGQMEHDDRPALRGFHAAFRFSRMHAREGFVRWCEAGATHHLAVARGHWSSAIGLLADIFGWQATLLGHVEERW